MCYRSKKSADPACFDVLQSCSGQVQIVEKCLELLAGEGSDGLVTWLSMSSR